MMTRDPAEPNEPSSSIVSMASSIVSMASNASSKVMATTTRFPAANPSALTTMGAP
uniref:Phosphoribosylamine--glycine ligase n=1 Tax=Arundo donax TaxID=35708 RepID=A0A0A9GIL7_ARUDO